MAEVKVLMPQMGESVLEGTIIKWFKKEGDTIDEEETLLEIATDKVDTEIPSPFGGKITKLLAQEGEVVQIGKPIALVETGVDAEEVPTPQVAANRIEEQIATIATPASNPSPKSALTSIVPKDRFYSPLVLNIAKTENISFDVLATLPGSGTGGRVTKSDIFTYLETRKNGFDTPITPTVTIEETPTEVVPVVAKPTFEDKKKKNHIMASRSLSGNDEIIEMDRMRKVIAERMLDSKRISAHVTSFVEADVSNVVQWRSKWKQHFMDKENTVLTYTPIFIHAIVKAIKDYPLINASVLGNNIHIKKDINIGLAVALPNGNLIVPVIKGADQLNILGLTKQVNLLAKKARNNELTADDLTGGTYTVSNMGSFGNVMGTPIIVQPQIAIMALGAVRKKPAVIETPEGDTIGIRQMMMLSHTYDHRIVDGSLGGMFVRRVADYLEKLDPNGGM